MRNDWSQQSSRLWLHLLSHIGQEQPAPVLNKAAAGEAQYIASFTKRISECRAKARSLGMDLVKTRDEWRDGQRHTAYTLISPWTQ